MIQGAVKAVHLSKTPGAFGHFFRTTLEKNERLFEQFRQENLIFPPVARTCLVENKKI